MDDIELKFSHSEYHWDVYMIFQDGKYVNGLYLEKDKLIPYVSKYSGDIIVMTKEQMEKHFNEDGSYGEELENDKHVKKLAKLKYNKEEVDP